MYTNEDLKKYEYFEGGDTSFILDSLTGVISRQYILDFARTLIDKKIPFAMCMMDLDNFKYVNDSYGHRAGDELLKAIANGLINYVGDDGLVGRFGGDEFIILYLKSNDYEDVHSFFAGMYGDTGAVRKSYYIDNIRIYVTATVGSAAFPKDAPDYNELFLKMDKALYRGKSKGRNCYIIYVHEKHKDIVVVDRGTNSLLSRVRDARHIIETATDNDDKIAKLIDYLHMTLHPAKTFFVYKNNDIYSAINKEKYAYGSNISFMLDKMVGDKDIFPTSSPQDVKNRYPDTISYMERNNVHAFVVARVTGFGFVVMYENAVTRIWQDYDLVLVNVAATFLSYNLKK